MIAIIDYGMGNLRSVQKAFEAVGAQAKITNDTQSILDACSVVLPGVGAFKDCMDNLVRFDLVDVIHSSIKSGKPFLGICLGLQLLFEQSNEFGNVPGLGIFPGQVERFHFKENSELKIPHMGWNTVNIQKKAPLFNGIDSSSYFYFVHSYFVKPEDPDIVATTTCYGEEFVSGIQFENIYAFQFHPEKSQSLGLNILKNFSQLN